LSIPEWVTSATYEDLVDECLQGLTRLSIPACIQYQARILKIPKNSYPYSDTIERWKHKACRGCKYRLRFDHQVRSVQALLRTGWRWGGKQAWRPKTGFRREEVNERSDQV